MEQTKQPLAASEMKVDAHCHLFNKKIASIPLLLRVIMILLEPKKFATEEDLETDSFGAHAKLLRVAQLIKMLFARDDEKLLDYIRKCEHDTIFAPLMIDLKFAVDSDQGLDTVREMKSLLENEIQLMYQADESETFLRADEQEEINFDELFEEIDEFISERENVSVKLRSKLVDDTFDRQYKQLLGIKNRNKAIIKPFFAVDPRRYDVVERMKIALDEDGFTGVKLYSPIGYSPLDPRLRQVYEYCVKHEVPITAHCSYGGFATLENEIDVQGYIYRDGAVVRWDDKLKFDIKVMEPGGIEERALALNHPDLWKQVLETYPGLKLNLAHMGIRANDDLDKKYEWSNLIVKMMVEHENLYTDLSCMIEKDEIRELWALASKSDKECDFDLKVTDRVLFGTDFWLSMLFKYLKKYMRDFEAVFSPGDLARIQQANPQRFLGIR